MNFPLSSADLYNLKIPAVYFTEGHTVPQGWSLPPNLFNKDISQLLKQPLQEKTEKGKWSGFPFMEMIWFKNICIIL